MQPTSQPNDADREYSALQARIAEVRQESADRDEKNRQRYGDDASYLVRPGLLADKAARTVTVAAYATGLSGNDPIEFFLIGPASGKAYESVAVSLAKPSDIRAALEFVGVPPGRPVNYRMNRFFPRGERVRMTLRWEDASPDGNLSPVSARVEEMLLLRNADGSPSQATLPVTGLVFTGGVFLPPEQPGGEERFLADLGDPGAIASNYNEPTTVLDLPAMARQSEVYRSRVVNPAYSLKPGQKVTVVLEPASPADAPARVVDLKLAAKTGQSGDLRDLLFTLTSPGLTGLPADAPSGDLLAALTRLIDAGQEPFVMVEPAAELPLSTVRQLYTLLAALQTDNGIRLEPGTPAHPFYEAFLPDEKLRDPANRLWQPVELQISSDGKAVLRDYAEKNLTAPGEARYTTTDTPVATPDSLKDLLAARVDQRRPLAVYAPKDLTYGDLQRWLAPSLGQDWILWVYLE
jgi:hypothetical protein